MELAKCKEVMKEQDGAWDQRYTAQCEELLQVMRRYGEEKKQVITFYTQSTVTSITQNFL